jgi:hypothetical protein
MIGFRIRQNGATLSQGRGPDAEAEIIRQAVACRNSGDVTVQHDACGHWKRFAFFSQWPDPAAKEQA